MRLSECSATQELKALFDAFLPGGEAEDPQGGADKIGQGTRGLLKGPPQVFLGEIKLRGIQLPGQGFPFRFGQILSGKDFLHRGVGAVQLDDLGCPVVPVGLAVDGQSLRADDDGLPEPEFILQGPCRDLHKSAGRRGFGRGRRRGLGTGFWFAGLPRARAGTHCLRTVILFAGIVEDGGVADEIINQKLGLADSGDRDGCRGPASGRI